MNGMVDKLRNWWYVSNQKKSKKGLIILGIMLLICVPIWYYIISGMMSR